MPKSLLSDKTTRRPKEPFDPALEDPVALTPDQLETVVGGSTTFEVVGQRPATVSGLPPGTTFGLVGPLKPPGSSPITFAPKL